MKAMVRRVYGGPEVLQLVDVEKPVAGDGEVLVRIHAASVNAADWHLMRGEPKVARVSFGLRKPNSELMGSDFAGTVESVGPNVKQLKVGDAVFGGRNGAFAEYVCVPEDKQVVLKPANVTFEEAAAVPIAAITALQALRDGGHVEAGQSVLVNGAGGGVGTFAVQIAKSFGAHVTAVSSTANLEMLGEIGADEVLDYTTQDFIKSEKRYDLMIDVAGNRTWSECKRVLTAKASYVVVGGLSKKPWLGPLTHSAALSIGSLGASQHVVPLFLAKLTREDLTVLQGLLQSGRVKPVIDRTYSLIETPDAIRYLEAGHARGKVVITVRKG